MSSSSQFRPPGPPSLDSQQYAADYEEVKQLGAAVGSTRTEDQTEIALFWADGAGTETPPGHWNSIAQIIAAARGNTMEENARLFALLNIAMADAVICAWDAKYTFNFWRPVTAIAFAEPQLNWMSFIVTPPFPDYTSGHSTVSAAAATVLPLFYGTEDLPFTTGSDVLPGVFRSFSTCFDAAEEAAVSRIYGGIHFRSASEDGLQAGISIGEWTVTNYLQPKHNRGASRTDKTRFRRYRSSVSVPSLKGIDVSSKSCLDASMKIRVVGLTLVVFLFRSCSVPRGRSTGGDLEAERIEIEDHTWHVEKHTGCLLKHVWPGESEIGRHRREW